MTMSPGLIYVSVTDMASSVVLVIRFFIYVKHTVQDFLPEISAEDMNAVNGIASIMPRLDERPLIVSSETKAVENK